MKKSRLAILAFLGIVALSSCGIFKKGCDCPVFKAYKQLPAAGGIRHS
ncbi:MAG: hypothetical protein ACTHMI_14505 [Mucilaginibacter sp.]